MHPAGGQPHITGPRTHQALPARREARLVVERGRHPGVRQHLPGAAAVAGGQDAERAVHRVAHREAVSAVEEGHAVVEGLRVGVAEGLRPGRSGVVGAVDAGRLALADRQDDRVPRVERLDVPELEVGRAGRRDVPPARPAVGRAQHRAGRTGHPRGVPADRRQPPEPHVGGPAVLELPVRSPVRRVPRLRRYGGQRGQCRPARHGHRHAPVRTSHPSRRPHAPHGGRS